MEMKHWWWMVAGLMLISLASATSQDAFDEAEEKALIRNERAAKGKGTPNCRYSRGEWSECDPKTQLRSRSFTLKHGDNSCEHTRTVHKKCKKSCRYEKTAWSECNASGEMSRTDTLKPNSDPTCDKTKRVTKKCNKNKQAKTSKDKGRRNRQ